MFRDCPPYIPFVLSAALALVAPSSALADTVGHWRFDDDGAAAGGAIAAAINVASPGTLDAGLPTGTPLFADDVVAAEIYDPVADAVLDNEFSLDASGANARLWVDDNVALNTSFTVEFFLKVGGEPASYESFLRRRQAADLLWQVDFDHALNVAFGRIRSRWDTPAGPSDDMAENGIDENVNFVLGPQGGSSAPRIYIDTGAEDELGNDVGPQNTGNVADYVFVAGSANPSETDVALQGDGINDDDRWHHVAMTFDQGTGEISFFYDYTLSQRRTLSDSEADGYTHPAAALEFGKFSGGDYALFLDEVRYSDTLLTPGQFLRPAGDSEGSVVGHWRMEDGDAADGATIAAVENSASVLYGATPNAAPTYSADVPAAMIYDPIADVTLPNAFSLDASGPNARLRADTDETFNSSFTAEMFIKLVGEPAGYHTFMRRRQLGDLRWQFDFDHANGGAFGRPRTRWDTPAGKPDNNAENGVDENVNFVVGPTGGAGVPESQRIFIDTDAGDGLLSSYDDPGDWANDGDGINDLTDWRHVAITFDQETGSVTFFLDHEAVQSRVLSDSQADGYTHPDGPFEFGKFAGADYGLLIDEVRYSSGVLFPEQMLQAVSEPPLPFEITAFAYDDAARSFTLTWRTVVGSNYFVDRYDETFEVWEELEDSLTAESDSMTYVDEGIPASLGRAIYRVRDGEL
jgi:hypothetical protein